MRNQKLFWGLVFLVFLLPSCDWILKHSVCDSTGPVIVYKTKQDYSNNVFIQLSKDGTEVTAYPAPSDAIIQKPVRLADGYLLKCMVGNAVTSLTIDEYASSTIKYSTTDLLELVIDKDPYTEKYECCECTKGDTASINNLIRTKQLGNCEVLK